MDEGGQYIIASNPMDLHRLALFSGLSAEDLGRLETRLTRREFPPQAIIVREGSGDEAAYVILSGRVAVRRKDPDSGVEFVLAGLGEGQMVGEMALLTRKPRTATVVALEATTCAVLQRAALEELVSGHPSVAMAMMVIWRSGSTRRTATRGSTS